MLWQLVTSYREHVQDRGNAGALCRVADVTQCGQFHFARLEPGVDGDGRWVWGDSTGPHERDLVLLQWDDNAISSDQLRGFSGSSMNSSKVYNRDSNPTSGKRDATAMAEHKNPERAFGPAYALGLVERRRERERFIQLKLFLGNGGARMDCMRHRLTVAANHAQEITSSKPERGKRSVDKSGGRWRVFRLHASLSTSEREYVAVHSVRALPQYVQAAILDPSPNGLRKPIESSLTASVAEGLNQAQALAVSGALDRGAPFTLIQGPPGTGKTKTIVALVSALVGATSDGGAEWSGVRVLVCAPSNAAVDEIAMRLFQGLSPESSGGPMRIVRVGGREQMRPEVWDAMSVDRLAERGQDGKVADDSRETTRHSDSLIGAAASGIGDERSAAVRALGRAARDAAVAVAEFRRSGQQARARVLAAARVVCSTLSGAGSAAVRGADRNSAFDVVVVDEAAQAVEASALVPLALLCGGGGMFKCVLVGDPQQLPATVLSRVAEEHLYGRSLFERLQAAGQEPLLLSVCLHCILNTFCKMGLDLFDLK